ncbi:MAG TPA: phosphatase PAP2 family protein [Mycobacteriales bacterium]|nr:phosphatase PAP2 family protein [Mycobacteriales bacterium]
MTVASRPVPASARTTPRRRPSGEPPPLPRNLAWSGKTWVGAALLLLLLYALHLTTGSSWGAAVTRADQAVVQLLADGRRPGLTSAARAVAWVAGSTEVQVLWVGALLAMSAARRWRHLLVAVGALVLVRVLVELVSLQVQRPRPYAVTALGPWEGFAMPSRPVAVLTAVLMCALYGLVPQGRLRQAGKALVGLLVGAVLLARCYLGQDNPSDGLVAVVIGVTVPLVAFRLLAPYEVFPVQYSRRRTAHLEITPARHDAVCRALRDQLGVIADDIEPFALAGSGGSTPLRIRAGGHPEGVLFGKLYAANHLRSDRWYKLGRALLYGGLEDEKAFNSVRRLVQYEDYALRLLRDAGLPVPAPYGIVEITPEREYLLVTQFVPDAVEVGEARIDVDLIDQGLAVVRRLWDAGLAHRDIKPANLLVQHGRLVLIDSAFSEVRPSPWRQAVDLANMMLVLALRTDPPLVYERARLVFTEDEIAEAFAATRGLTMPSQLRRLMRAQGRDLHAEFKRLLPRPVHPIAIQHWSARRAGLTLAVLAAVALLVASAPALLLGSSL